MRFRTDLLIEGVATVDGRSLVIDATEWKIPPSLVRGDRHPGLPILYADWRAGLDYDPPILIGSIDLISREYMNGLDRHDVRVVAYGRLFGDPRVDRVREMAADGTMRLGVDLRILEPDMRVENVPVDPRAVSLHRTVVMIKEPQLVITRAEVRGATVVDPPAPAWPELRFELLAP